MENLVFRCPYCGEEHTLDDAEVIEKLSQAISLINEWISSVHTPVTVKGRIGGKNKGRVSKGEVKMDTIALWVNIEGFKQAIAGLSGTGEFRLTVASDGRIWIDGGMWHRIIQGKPAIIEVELR